MSNCQHTDRPLQHINKKVASSQLVADRKKLTLSRVDQYHNVLIVEPSASHAQPTFAVSVAAKRHMRKEPAHKTVAILRVSFRGIFRGITTAVSDNGL